MKSWGGIMDDCVHLPPSHWHAHIEVCIFAGITMLELHAISRWFLWHWLYMQSSCQTRKRKPAASVRTVPSAYTIMLFLSGIVVCGCCGCVWACGCVSSSCPCLCFVCQCTHASCMLASCVQIQRGSLSWADSLEEEFVH